MTASTASMPVLSCPKPQHKLQSLVSPNNTRCTLKHCAWNGIKQQQLRDGVVLCCCYCCCCATASQSKLPACALQQGSPGSQRQALVCSMVIVQRYALAQDPRIQACARSHLTTQVLAGVCMCGDQSPEQTARSCQLVPTELLPHRAVSCPLRGKAFLVVAATEHSLSATKHAGQRKQVALNHTSACPTQVATQAATTAPHPRHVCTNRTKPHTQLVYN